MRQRGASLVLPRRRTPFTRKRKMGPSSNALASRVRWRLASAPRKSDCHLEHARTSRWQHERAISPRACRYRVIGQKVRLGYSAEYGYAVLWWNSDHISPLPARKVNRPGTCTKKAAQGGLCYRWAERVVRPYSRLSLYKADRYRARDGRGWFPEAQASPKYAPSRSCRTNGRTSARIC